MKKLVMIGSFLLSVSLFAHDHFLYTTNLDVSGMREVKMKAMLGHPAEGVEGGAIDIATVDGKTHLPNKFFVVHGDTKTDLLPKVKVGIINDGKANKVSLDATYTTEDGLKGNGNWIFFMDPGQTKDSGYTFNPALKLIVAKDGGSDFNKRVAEGHPEIIPLSSPVNAWKENVFRAKFVDENGNPIKNARVDVDFLNVKIDLDKNLWKGQKELPKSSLRVYTDDMGVLAFNPSRAGQWVVRAVKQINRDKKEVVDASLVVQFD